MNGNRTVRYDGRIWTAVIVVSLAVIFAASYGGRSWIEGLFPDGPAPGAFRVAAAASIVLLLFVGLLALVIYLASTGSAGPAAGAGQPPAPRVDGVATLVTGADQRLSTGKTQIVLWTWFVGLGLLFQIGILLAAFHWPQSLDTSRLVDLNVSEAYLVLLGGPFAAYVVSKGVTADRVAGGTVQKTTGTGALGLGQLAQDDDGRTSLVDTQYLVFNVLLLSYCIVSFIHKPIALPDVPTALVGLTGASALTYAASKGVYTNKPVLTSVLPAVPAGAARAKIAARKDLWVIGSNLSPQGTRATTADKWLVRFVWGSGKVQNLVVRATHITRDPDCITACVPAGAKGDVKISVITPAQAETDPLTVTI